MQTVAHGQAIKRVFTRRPRLSASSAPRLIRISTLGAYLSKRTTDRLRRAGLLTLGDVMDRGLLSLLAIEGLGEKSYAEVTSCLRAHGLMAEARNLRGAR